MERLLPQDRVDDLLYHLCVDLGFCLPAADQERIKEDPPRTVDSFTDAVFAAEGMDHTLYPNLRKQVLDYVAKAFAAP